MFTVLARACLAFKLSGLLPKHLLKINISVQKYSNLILNTEFLGIIIMKVPIVKEANKF